MYVEEPSASKVRIFRICASVLAHIVFFAALANLLIAYECKRKKKQLS